MRKNLSPHTRRPTILLSITAGLTIIPTFFGCSKSADEKANEAFVKADALIEQCKTSKDYTSAIRPFEEAKILADSIVERYPSSRIGVELVSGHTKINGITLDRIRTMGNRLALLAASENDPYSLAVVMAANSEDSEEAIEILQTIAEMCHKEGLLDYAHDALVLALETVPKIDNRYDRSESTEEIIQSFGKCGLSLDSFVKHNTLPDADIHDYAESMIPMIHAGMLCHRSFSQMAEGNEEALEKTVDELFTLIKTMPDLSEFRLCDEDGHFFSGDEENTKSAFSEDAKIYLIGNLFSFTNNPKTIAQMYEYIRGLEKEHGVRILNPDTTANIARITSKSDLDYSRKEFLPRLSEVIEQIEDETYQPSTIAYLASAMTSLGEKEKADELFSMAIQRADDLESSSSKVFNKNRIGFSLAFADQKSRALEILEQSASLAKEYLTGDELVIAKRSNAWAYYHAGRTDRCIELMTDALKDSSFDDSLSIAHNLNHKFLSRKDLAVSALKRSVEKVTISDTSTLGRSEKYIRLISAALEIGDKQLAGEFSSLAREQASNIVWVDEKVAALSKLATLNAEFGNTESASSLLNEAFHALPSSSELEDYCKALTSLGIAVATTGLEIEDAKGVFKKRLLQIYPVSEFWAKTQGN